MGTSVTNALLAEQSGTYLHGTVIDILLAFMWSKFSTPQEFDRYCTQLMTTMGATCTTATDCQQAFTKNDYEKFKTLNNPQQILSMNLDELVYTTLGYNFYDNTAPAAYQNA